jgi:Cu2+-containing amine oxidase
LDLLQGRVYVNAVVTFPSHNTLLIMVDNTYIHPLTALSEDEIWATARLIRSSRDPGTKLRFKGISLHEPTKTETRQFLEATKDGISTAGRCLPPRKAWVNYYLVGTGSFFEAIVNLTSEIVERNIQVADGFHGSCDDDEILEVERLTLNDARVKVEIEKLKLPGGAVVVCDPWIWFVASCRYVFCTGLNNLGVPTVSTTILDNTSATCTCVTRISLATQMVITMHTR